MSDTDAHILPLSLLGVEHRARIAEIDGGHSLHRRLLALGLRPGATLQVMHRRGQGLVVACGGSRIALGAGMAERVLVEPLATPAAPDGPSPG